MTTRDEFEQAYAKRSGLAVWQLHYFGRFAEPCTCDYSGCEGWAMGHQHDEALFEEQTRRLRHVRSGE